MSTIEWTDETWNPTVGCQKCSAGCLHCYAEDMHSRLTSMEQEKYEDEFNVVKIYPDHLYKPYMYSKPSRVFVNSMSDLFHKDIPLEYIQQVFVVMNDNPQHQFQVLTKRSERLMAISNELNWSDNIWMGVSVENEKVMSRIDHLRQTGAKIKFISAEPLIGPLPNMNLAGIHWVIVGGESAWKYRPMEESWALDILHQCRKARIPFFFKQWSGTPTNKKKSGRLLKGKAYDEYPVEL